jgi:hypothetical protein
MIFFLAMLPGLISRKFNLLNQGNWSEKRKKYQINALKLLFILGVIDSILNIVMHRGWWESDFFSPFFTGFKN